MPADDPGAYLDPAVMAALAGNPSQVQGAPRAEAVQPDIMGMSFAEQKQFSKANPEAWAQLLRESQRPMQAPQGAPQQMQEKLLPGAVPVGNVEAFSPFGLSSKVLSNPKGETQPVPQQPQQPAEDPGILMNFLNFLLGR